MCDDDDDDDDGDDDDDDDDVVCRRPYSVCGSIRLAEHTGCSQVPGRH